MTSSTYIKIDKHIKDLSSQLNKEKKRIKVNKWKSSRWKEKLGMEDNKGEGRNLSDLSTSKYLIISIQ